MASQLRFEAEAERELDDAALMYDEQRPGLGQRFLNEVGVTTERIRQLPGAGAPVKHVPAGLGVRQAPVKGFPYHVVYLNTAQDIRVLQSRITGDGLGTGWIGDMIDQFSWHLTDCASPAWYRTRRSIDLRSPGCGTTSGAFS